jgi:tRNA U55 pseudouridine synthase TruB
MKIIDNENKIKIKKLQEMSKKMFENLVKAVVDVEKEIMAIDAPMHSDQEAELIKNGSRQVNLWGINLYPGNVKKFIEFDSMINLKPNQNNRSRGIDSPKIKKKVIQVVNKLVKK